MSLVVWNGRYQNVQGSKINQITFPKKIISYNRISCEDHDQQCKLVVWWMEQTNKVKKLLYHLKPHFRHGSSQQNI